MSKTANQTPANVPTIDAAAAKKAEAAAAKKAAAEAKKAEAAAKKAADQAAKAEAKAKAEADKLAAKQAKEAAKAKAKEMKEASKMPEQNGVRRPKPGTKCGDAWAVFDSISASNGAPASIAEALTQARSNGMNEGNVRAEYARWRKFHGITGRVVAPKAEAAQPTA